VIHKFHQRIDVVYKVLPLFLPEIGQFDEAPDDKELVVHILAYTAGKVFKFPVAGCNVPVKLCQRRSASFQLRAGIGEFRGALFHLLLEPGMGLLKIAVRLLQGFLCLEAGRDILVHEHIILYPAFPVFHRKACGGQIARFQVFPADRCRGCVPHRPEPCHFALFHPNHTVFDRLIELIDGIIENGVGVALLTPVGLDGVFQVARQ